MDTVCYKVSFCDDRAACTRPDQTWADLIAQSQGRHGGVEGTARAEVFDVAIAGFVEIPFLLHFWTALFMVRFESLDSILHILGECDIMGIHGLLAWG